MKELTIVTAIFDIGRGEWQKSNRSLDKYIEYFKFWARIRNKIIVYTDAETGDKILKIREQFNLRERTKVVVIADITKCDAEIYHMIKRAMENKISQTFRYYPERPESYNYKYNYTVLLKPYFVADAVKKGYADGMIAWLDFGYNHGGEMYVNPEEFDYLWKYNFSEYIHLFAMQPFDDKPIFQIVRSLEAYIAGGLIVAPAYLWNPLWKLCREAMVHLTACGLADDDQTLLLMAYRKSPELFAVHPIEDWNMPLKLCGGEHFTIKTKPRKSAISIWWRGVKNKLKEWRFK